MIVEVLSFEGIVSNDLLVIFSKGISDETSVGVSLHWVVQAL
jgi:hypothetical protein